MTISSEYLLGARSPHAFPLAPSFDCLSRSTILFRVCNSSVVFPSTVQGRCRRSLYITQADVSVRVSQCDECKRSRE